jgi:hypothetical protein
MIQALLFILILHLGVNFTGFALAGSQPAITTSLSAGITASDTTIPVTGSGVAGFPEAGWLYIQSEAIQYTGTTSSCPAPYTAEPACFTGASRGQQATIGVSHLASTRVFNEASGLLNDLSTFETRTSIDELGDITSPWSSGTALVRFLSQSLTWDWPMFEGDFAVFRIFGAAFTIAISVGIFTVLATILTSAIRSVRP